MVRQFAPVIASDLEDDEDEDANVVASGEIEPASYKEAMMGPQANKWKDVALEEYNWHLQNGTWELVELPPEMKAILISMFCRCGTISGVMLLMAPVSSQRSL